MTVVRLVRHGRAAAGWDTALDPDLDEVGRRQAEEVAARLADLGPLPVITSPMLRCRSTAAPLAARWGVVPVVAPQVSEIPSPQGVAMDRRSAWLRTAIEGTWSALGPAYLAYRDEVVAAIRAIPTDTVVFSHFIAINTVIGACLGRDDLVVHRLDNCSVTEVEVRGDRLVLRAAGHEADTLLR